MRLITDPGEVERRAKELAEENWDFRNWIKATFDFDDERLMLVVQRLTEYVTARIDCTACAHCCRVMAGSVDEEDMERLAQALDMDVAQVMRIYLQEDEQDGWELLAPCPLLDGKLCSVYEARPTVCREYPHLHNDFRAASIARIHSAAVCPIVFNVIEGMKVELDWFDDEELDWLA